MSARDPKRTSKFGLNFCELLCLASHINVAFAYKLSGDGLDAYDAATIATKRWRKSIEWAEECRLHTRCALLHYDYPIRWLTGDFSPCRQIQSWNLLPQRRYNDRTLSPAPRE